MHRFLYSSNPMLDFAWGWPLIGVFSLFGVILIWTLIWKGLALWKAARQGSKIWFIILLIINTAGILEIVYLFLWDKIKNPSKPVKE